MKYTTTILVSLFFCQLLRAQVSCEENFAEDFTGYCFENYSNGKLKHKIHFVDGQKTGPYEEYYASGKIKAQGIFDYWELVGEHKRFYENGNLELHITTDSLVTGTLIRYFPNGGIKEQGQFEEAMRIGVWSTFTQGDSIPVKTEYNEMAEMKEKQRLFDEEHANDEGNQQWLLEWPESVTDEFFEGYYDPYY